MNQEKEEKEKSFFSQMEERVLSFWKESDTFKKSVEKEAPQGRYIFYDGPPFITGLPHYATLLPSIAKDLVPRYWTMKGYRVDRVWGWDCHGLPAENKVEESLDLKNKNDIEELGIDKFVGACRDYVDTGCEQWRWYIDRIGRWVDMDNSYKTMDLKFMESVIWAFKNLYDKNLIYEGYRTSLHCPRCATPLSKFEVTMDAGSYKEVEDPSIVVEFISEDNLHILAWTTTPWTLPGNLALAVNKDIDYLVVKRLGKRYLLAKDKLSDLFKEDFEIEKEIKGSELIGLTYKPVFDLKNSEINQSEKTFKIYEADFVDTEEGTGIVHIAPNFGENDFELGKREDLPIIELMDESGNYTDNSGEWQGKNFKEVNKIVLERIKDKTFLQEKHLHSYPFCYRCNSRLIHKTQKSWYLKVDEIREKIIESNKEINWIPEYFKEGRFKYNLENAPDWCLSRSRYWGSPLPIWRCEDCSKIKVVGSIKEIEELSGQRVTDLHRPEIDNIRFDCECGSVMKRVPEVLDCWFESGAMPFAQFHYPFERKDEWHEIFPADFIIEYTGQLRGWFYYLHLISNALFDSVAFKNVIVTGVLAGNDGRKMSKSFGNYPDPKITLDKYGSDALRIYFMSSPIMLGGDMNFSEQDLQDSLRKNIILLWNVAKFYDLFARDNNFVASEEELEPDNVLDKWIISRTNQLINSITQGLEEYNLPLACQAITPFVSDLSTWYIRRSRDRFKSENKQEVDEVLRVAGYLLIKVAKAIAPIMPFVSEQIWQKTTNNDFKDRDKSVHLESWPESGKIDEGVLKEMRKTREIVEIGLAQRDEKKVKVRQPLQKITVKNCILDEEYLKLIKEELNIKEVEVVPGDKDIEVSIDFEMTEELRMEGLKRELIRTINEMRKSEGLTINDLINISYKSEDKAIKESLTDDEVKKSVLAKEIREESSLGPNEMKEKRVNDSELFLVIRKADV